MISWFRRRVIRRSFRRRAQEIQTRLLEPTALGRNANDVGVINAWCIALPVLLFDIAFIRPAPSLIVLKALDRTARNEVPALFDGFLASCLAVLLSVGKTAKGFDQQVTRDFVARVVGFLDSTSLDDLQTTGAILDVAAPNEWFTTTLWLRVFRNIDSARSYYANALSDDESLLDSVGLRLLESALLEKVSTIVGLLGTHNLLAANAPKGGGKQSGAPSDKTLWDTFQRVSAPMLVSAYRSLAQQTGRAPTDKTSDEDIVRIYRRVGTAFREASNARGEHLPAGYMNAIVFKFYQVREMSGDAFLEEHLAYELKKYKSEGLRDDYKVDLKLF